MAVEKDPRLESTATSEPVHELMKRVEGALTEFKNKTGSLLFSYALGVVGLLMVFVLMTWLAGNRLLPPPEQRQALSDLEISSAELRNVFDALAKQNLAARGADGRAAGEAPAATAPGAPAGPAATAEELLSEGLEATGEMIAAARVLVSRPLPTQLAILQIVPLGGIVLVLGLLGLKRMQGYDRDIADARRELGANLQAGLDSVRRQTRATVEDAIAKGFQDQSERLQSLQDDIEQRGQRAADENLKVEERIEEAKDSIEALIAENPWLAEPTGKDWVERIKSLSSVDQAHQVAVDFLAGKAPNTAAAREALEAVVDGRSEPLRGRAEAFHNAFVQAMRPPISDPALGERIVEAGLEQHPQTVALVADLVQARDLLGKELPHEALAELRTTGAYWNDWRAVVFEAAAWARQGATEGIDRAIELLEEGVEKLSRDPRVWRNLADLYRQRGLEDKAEATFRRGLEACPHSQVLAYNFGELLVAWGRAAEGTELLERALRCDYQEQFESDVSQGAVLLTTGQAYEACGRFADAAETYRRFLDELRKGNIQPESRHMVTYARSRLALVGETSSEDEGGAPAIGPEQALAILEENAAEIPKMACVQLLHEHAGPPLPLERWMAALEAVRGAHDLEDQLYQALKQAIVGRYEAAGPSGGPETH